MRCSGNHAIVLRFRSIEAKAGRVDVLWQFESTRQLCEGQVVGESNSLDLTFADLTFARQGTSGHVTYPT
jgi:hypothetical protein